MRIELDLASRLHIHHKQVTKREYKESGGAKKQITSLIVMWILG